MDETAGTGAPRRAWASTAALLVCCATACGDSDAAGVGASASGGAGPTSGAGTATTMSTGTDTTSSSTGAGGGVEPPPPACAPAVGGGAASTAQPELVLSLGDQWHEAWLGSPAVADLDGDGAVEIVAARHGRLLVWRADGSILWQADLEGRCWSSPVVADIRTDLPGLEVAQASADKIYLFGADGAPVSGFPYAWRGELRSLAGGDVDGDGELELVSVTTQNLQANGQTDILIAVNPDGSTVQGFPPNTSGASGCDDACYVYNGYDQNVAIGDVDGDGVSDIFATQDNAYNSLHRGTGFAFDCAPGFTNKTKFLGVRGLHDFAEAQQGYANDEDTALQAHHTNTAPALADVDGDGVAELVYAASVQNAAQTERELGVALWVLENDGTRPAAWATPLHFTEFLSGLWDYGNNVVAITNQVSVAEVDPTRAGPEMYLAGFDGKIHAVDSQKNVIWSFTYTTDPEVATGGVIIADLSGDGVPEIVFTTYSNLPDASALFILDAGGNLQHEVPLPGRGAMPVPTVADADGDAVLDVVVSLKDESSGAQVLVFRVPGASDNCVLWGTGRGNYLRNGYLPPP